MSNQPQQLWDLSLADSKLVGLDKFLVDLRLKKLTYRKGLEQVINYVRDNNGLVEAGEPGETILKLGEAEATCFQPYPDIDLFYFES